MGFEPKTCGQTDMVFKAEWESFFGGIHTSVPLKFEVAEVKSLELLKNYLQFSVLKLKTFVLQFDDKTFLKIHCVLNGYR